MSTFQWTNAIVACCLITITSAATSFGFPDPPKGETEILIETSVGDIRAVLYDDEAPITVENFLSYVKKDHYEETIFHRVISGFMIQTGGMTRNMAEKPVGKGIKNESKNGLKNLKYTLAMARTSAPDSATAQFFINTVNNDMLDRNKARDGVGYCVFGEVIDGKDVVDKIEKVKTTKRGPHSDVPVEPIWINKIVIVDKSKDKPADAPSNPEKK